MVPKSINRWIGRWIYVLPFLPVALFAFYPKWLFLHDGGFFMVARGTGEATLNLGWFHKLALFRYDFALNLFILPAGLVGALSMLRPRWRSGAAAVFSIAVAFFVFANMLSYANVGRYFSLGMATDAVHWVLANPDYVGDYVSLRSIAKLATIVSIIVVVAVIAHKRSSTEERALLRKQGRITIAFVASVPAVIAGTGMYASLKDNHYDQPALQQMVTSLLAKEADSAAYDLLPVSTLKSRFVEATSGLPPARDERFFGKASGDDVVLFIFETGPSRSLDIDGDLTDFPNLRRLLAHGLTGGLHYSTYPYTSRAIFSILSGIYPIDALEKYFVAHPYAKAPGLMQNLRADGYLTASYAPARSEFTPDTQMFRALGIERQRIADAKIKENDSWQRILDRDRSTVDLLLTDMDGWLREHRHFAAIIMPQVSHGPWRDIVHAGNNYPARGRALLAIQDRWIGRIMDLLEKYHRLNKTIIVVTADHGIRTRVEDPSFSGGTIDDYSFHVPLVVWAPTAFPRHERVPWLSSHIDIAPTVLDLLGNTRERTLLQGSALWDPHLRHRKTFFFARGYLGADGYYQDGRFAMVNFLSGLAYRNDRLSFSPADLITDSAEKHRLFSQFDSMDAMLTSWINRFPDTSRETRGAIQPTARRK